ncbi:nitrogen regulation protein NR(II) [Pseudoalteromonas sp. MMG013]|uniref:Sensory histidine kinase/phosphatase NtrB n=1 Tax=Pseudoalteromonas aurantia 208 TaxID=1314867 RepID=A0ABR9EFT6_9GAMM|nr:MULTISPECIES: nitrogen regulation protein NR(II) [Pseudoalteromonas]MBE0369774.1 two-component system, NtrC family, nitrogen regulation sensor histidine kinase GlnL [Pseudoalteromonas aurantia 208]MBQ4844290.1 nitrogen regulation protein NR(II) [Pseudoalteromonas sp. MMG005]MBQ4850091.1 nitrogen regulation protein NR(II) [Pseudoalteromonas sp. MMG012]MBQ4861371.1 nitrogen regulation protein NR(II) [Pseudoalteromonas sp. MMG013]
MEQLHEQLLPDLWHNLATSVILLDKNFIVHYANTSSSELFGLGIKRLIGQSLHATFSHHHIDITRINQYVLKDGVDCQQHRVDVVFIDNRAATLNLHARRVHLLNTTYILMEFRRIDDEVRFDQASNQMHQYHAARTLIRGLAHEIKNPLGGIRGAAQLLQYEGCQSERDQCAELIIEQTDRLTDLVDRLLGPNQLLHKAPCNIHQTLESVIKLSTLDNEHNIKLIKDYDPSIPDINIDQAKIQQVVLNIVRNALQALTQGGNITLTTRIKHRLRRGEKLIKKALLIKIMDNGPGIAPELKDTLFFPMTTNKDGGSGLGLSIAQTLIEQHNGMIDYDSWTGHTEFNIYLPF